jgi:3-deoxy-D-manno-octulosonate 8-phosphate phosphatase (KDO 8-P phosphatase)
MNNQESAIKKAKNIKLILLDVDGVLTDGKIYYASNGVEYKAFNSQDGLGIKMLLNAGIEVGIITARRSELVSRRMNELGVKYVYQGQANKLIPYEKIRTLLTLEDHQIAYIGDDLTDIVAIKRAGLGIAVANATPFVLQQADWVTARSGGLGAVREACEFILAAQNKLTSLYEQYLLGWMTPLSSLTSRE